MSEEMPMPIEQISDEQAMLAVFGRSGPRDDTPLGAAFLWCEAVLAIDEPTAFANAQVLSYNAPDWGDYGEQAAGMRGWAVARNIEVPTTGESDIAYVKLLRANTSGRSFATVRLAPEDVQWITTVEAAPGVWRVWGISAGDYRPSAKRVMTGED